MKQGSAINPTTPQIASVDHLANSAEDTPLRRYFATFDQNGDGQQLLRHIRLYVHNANLAGEQSAHEIALEIMQELVVEALRSEHNFDSTRKPKPWLLGIAANLIKRRREMLFRQRKRETPVTDLTTVDGLTEEQLFDRIAFQAQFGPEQEVLAGLGVEELLAQLPSNERYIIEQNVLHEMSAVEVAHALDITPGNARVRLHRVLKKLRAILLEQIADRQEKQSHE